MVFLIVVGVGIYGLMYLSHQNDTIATIEKDGEVLYQFQLREITTTRTYRVGEPGQENEITVSPEGICVSHADCPDQTCVHQGVRSHGPTPIVCLPHHLTIRFSDSAAGGIDASTGQ